MEDAGTSEEDDIDSQDSNTPIDHGHLARNCSVKIITPAVKASVISSTGHPKIKNHNQKICLCFINETHFIYIYIYIYSPSFQWLHLRHSSFWFSNLSVTSPKSQLILQPFPRFTYVTAHSPTLPSLYLRHSTFSNPSVASPTSQLILRPFFRLSYVTGSSLTSPGEPPMVGGEAWKAAGNRIHSGKLARFTAPNIIL